MADKKKVEKKIDEKTEVKSVKKSTYSKIKKVLILKRKKLKRIL